MELFREKLKVQNLAIAMCCFILAIFSFLAAAGQAGIIGFMQPATDNSHWQSMWRGIVTGMSTGIMIVMIAFLIRNILALKDEKKLKKLEQMQCLLLLHIIINHLKKEFINIIKQWQNLRLFR